MSTNVINYKLNFVFKDLQLISIKKTFFNVPYYCSVYLLIKKSNARKIIYEVKFCTEVWTLLKTTSKVQISNFKHWSG